MYSVVECVNGNYSVKAEGLSEQAAKVFYFGRCQALWNASDVITGTVAILTPELFIFGGYSERIEHAPQEQGE